ncbi:hypothetical protein HHI36_014021 [Cryptolaemus montrouzieri]|uniref:Glutamyl-tRNA(Gln) amidotransferase subunit C, mitochondrial n=1 Tax=Cryptolaemus montrouzieri TaxID=559131 RepID=A0ABD2N1M9_9CUCU
MNFCKYSCSINTILIFKRNFSKTNLNLMKPITRIQSNKSWSKQQQNTVKIDKETVNLLERLSLVDCANEQSLKLIENAVNFANAIHSVETEGVEPLITVAEDRPIILREDIVEESNKKEILQNASVIEEDYFVVPPGNVPLESDDLFEKHKVEVKINNVS